MKMRKDYVFKAKFILMTDMGASIECFKGASALVVPRIRFSPVERRNYLLLLLRSDNFMRVNSIHFFQGQY